MIAVFDLDGTLLSADSTDRWLRQLFLASPLRLIAAALVLPFALPLVLVPPWRGYGASVLLWIATVGRDEHAVKQCIDAFVHRFEANETGLHWYADARVALKRHMDAGDRVVVVTGAPQWLAQRIMAPWGDRIHVIGSTLRPRWGGWVVRVHCRNTKKCTALREAGFGTHWDVAYSDSDDDAPILAAARESFLVNADERKQRRAAALGAANVQVVHWK